jgi:hypothetical protein
MLHNESKNKRLKLKKMSQLTLNFLDDVNRPHNQPNTIKTLIILGAEHKGVINTEVLVDVNTLPTT